MQFEVDRVPMKNSYLIMIYFPKILIYLHRMCFSALLANVDEMIANIDLFLVIFEIFSFIFRVSKMNRDKIIDQKLYLS